MLQKPMKYYLKIAAHGQFPKIKITKERYESILSSWGFICLVSKIEEHWDCLIQNYIALEQEMVKEAVNSMVLRHTKYSEFADIRLSFARHLSNFLSSTRSYLDSTDRLLKHSGHANVRCKFKEATSKAYDGSFGYRFMEELRNHSQHAGLPIHQAGLHTLWIEDEATKERAGRLRHSAQAAINIEQLRSVKGFKKKILDEVDTNESFLNISLPLREYVEGLGQVHDNLRSELGPNFNAAKLIINEAIGEYSKVNSGKTSGLSATKFENDQCIARQSIVGSVILLIADLQTRNGTQINLHKRYVSSQIIDRK